MHGKHIGIKQPIHLVLVDLLIPEIVLVVCHGTGHSSISDGPNEFDVFEVSSAEPLDDQVIADRLQWSDADSSADQQELFVPLVVDVHAGGAKWAVDVYCCYRGNLVRFCTTRWSIGVTCVWLIHLNG